MGFFISKNNVKKVLLINFVFMFLIGLPIQLNAQIRGNYSSTNQNAILFYERALSSYRSEKFDETLKWLNNAKNEDAYFFEVINLLGDVYRKKGNLIEAIKYYEELYGIDPLFNPKIVFYLGRLHFDLKEFFEAKKYYEEFYKIKLPTLSVNNDFLLKKLIADCEFAPLAIANKVDVKLTNMGESVNSSYDEYLPSITADDNFFLFTRRTEDSEDFYYVKKNQDGSWSKAQSLSSRINTKRYNEGAQSLSIDGRYLYFTGCNRRDGFGRCDIYVSKKIGNRWSIPENLGHPINTPYWESQPSLSADGRTLYFVSNRKGSIGGYDLWKSTKNKNNEWGKPVNLGKQINTPLNEQSPFIHPDNKTLYFSSDGRAGIGREDLFVVRKTKKGKWGIPENIGYPLNTNRSDFGLIISTDGKKGYLSSSINSKFGGFDIYQFEFPVKHRPQEVTYLKGKIVSAETNTPLRIEISIKDSEDERTMFNDYTDALTGEFISVLEIDKKYIIKVLKENLILHSEIVVTKKNEIPPKPLLIKISGTDLTEIEISDENNVLYFEFDKTDLNVRSQKMLDKISERLILDKAQKISIEGYADNLGSDDYNMKLSKRRAKKVFDYLILKGIEKKRMNFVGFGERKIVSQKLSDFERQKNRCVNIKFIK